MTPVGPVRQLFDSAATATATYSYDAFGAGLSSSSVNTDPFRYRGEHFNSLLGFYYLRDRWFLPKGGRFLTGDHFEGLAEEALTANRYLYAASDPVNNSDPSGFLYKTSQITTTLLHSAAAVAAIGITGAAAECALVRVASELDKYIVSTGGSASLSSNLRPECQDPCQRDFQNSLMLSASPSIPTNQSLERNRNSKVL